MADEPEPHYLGHRQRLRERFLKSGLDGFADYEAVELGSYSRSRFFGPT